MTEAFREAADRILRDVAERENGVPGVVAMATSREGNFYEGAEGKRELGKEAAMTTDTVFAIYSCTKAITGVAVMQLVEEGILDFDSPAKEYAPEISDIQVLEGFDAEGNRASARRRPTSRWASLCCTPRASATTSSTKTW